MTCRPPRARSTTRNGRREASLAIHRIPRTHTVAVPRSAPTATGLIARHRRRNYSLLALLAGTLAIRNRSPAHPVLSLSLSLAFEMQSTRPSIIFQERPADERQKKRKKRDKESVRERERKRRRRNREKWRGEKAKRKDYRGARYPGEIARGDERWLYKTQV